MQPSLLAPERELAGTVDVPSTVLLLRRAAGTVLVDAGSGPLVGEWPGSGDDLAGALAAAGCALDQIDLVVLTHLDFDHCGGCLLLPGVPVAAPAGAEPSSVGQRARRCAAGVGGTAELDRRRRAGVGWPHAALSARSPQRTLGAGGGRRARPSGGCRAPSAARAAPGVGSRLRLRPGAGAYHADGTAGRDGGARRAGVGLPHRGLRADPALGRRGAVRGSRSDPAARSGG